MYRKKRKKILCKLLQQRRRNKKRVPVWEPFDTEQEAKTRKVEIELMKQEQKLIPQSQKTVKQICDKWVCTQNWSPRTYDTNMTLLKNHVLPHLGNRAVQEVTSDDIDSFFIKLRKTLKNTFKNGVRVRPVEEDDEWHKPSEYLSSSTIYLVYLLVDGIFSYAKTRKMIAESPVTQAPPKKIPVERLIWDDETMARALENMKDQPLLHLAIHMIFVGTLRSGECLAIPVNQIDLKKKRLIINQTLGRISKKSLKEANIEKILYVFPNIHPKSKSVLVIARPKTDSSNRIMNLTAPLRQEIEKRLQYIQSCKKRLGNSYHDYGLLICQDNGDPIESKLLLNWFHKWQKKQKETSPSLDESSFCSIQGAPPINIHCLRHSGTTALMELSGGDLKAVQANTGHRTLEMLNHYSHIREKTHRELTDRFEQKFYTHKSSGIGDEINTTLLFTLLQQAQNDPSIMEQLLKMASNNPQLQQTLLTALLTPKASK